MDRCIRFAMLTGVTKFGKVSVWFETGTPTYLVKLLRNHYYDLDKNPCFELFT